MGKTWVAETIKFLKNIKKNPFYLFNFSKQHLFYNFYRQVKKSYTERLQTLIVITEKEIYQLYLLYYQIKSIREALLK